MAPSDGFISSVGVVEALIVEAVLRLEWGSCFKL